MIQTENYDYKIKYDEDEYGKELSAEARVFWAYMDEAKLFDDDLVAELGDGLDLSLIFVCVSWNDMQYRLIFDTVRTLLGGSNDICCSDIAVIVSR